MLMIRMLSSINVIFIFIMTFNWAAASPVSDGYQYTHQAQVIDPGQKNLKRIQKTHPEFIIDHVNGLGYEIYGNENLKNQLKAMGVYFDECQKLVSNTNLMGYPTPEAINQKMLQLQAAYPSLVTVFEIGKSVEGRPLLVARLTSQPNQPNLREFKYVANMHGDEIMGRELMIRLIEDLAKKYRTDSQVTRLMDQLHIYIMPSLNPDGALRRSRFNAKNVDLNRTFPDFTTTDRSNTTANRAPEVQALMKFQAAHRFKLSANFHGGAEVVNYPWDTTENLFPLDNLVKLISTNYANRVPYLKNSSEFKGGIVNGYQWYEVDGGMQDWSYYWHQDVQVTIELTKEKWPDYSQVDNVYRLNRSALLGYIEEIFKL
jgi:hypothetical protein